MNEKNTSDSIIQIKRKRGGQPGNRNACGNRGNRSARGKRGNRGGCGAPFGNQYARKRRTLASEMAKDYAGCREALAWIAAQEAALAAEEIRSDAALDRAMFLDIALDE